MANFGAKIINNAISGLQAQQAQIANASNNIANVNTPGYSRRIVNLENRAGSVSNGGINIGDGVNVASITRVADLFLETALRTTTGEKGAADTQDEFLSRIQQLFNITGQQGSIGNSLTKFFSSFNDLSANPGSIELRTNVIQAAQDLVTTISTTYNSLANLQKEADSRVVSEVAGINAMTAKIADLNDKIKSREAGGGAGSAADERDQRDLLLQQLAGKISYDKIDLADGTVTLSLSNGFSLVSGSTSRQLETTTNPSFDSTPAPSLYGAPLSYIVYDYDSGAGTSHIDLTNFIKQGQGSLGALLDLRGVAASTDTTAFQAQGTIPDLASKVEDLTRSLLTDFNQVYIGGTDRDPSTANFQPSSGDLNGTPPATFGLFDFVYSGVKDSTTTGTIGYPEGSDLNALISTGAVKNFSSILTVAFSDPRRLAAARDSSTGAPAAAIYSPGDNRNALAMANLQSSTLTLGSISGITVGDYYNQIVGNVGNLKASAALAKTVSANSLTAAQNRRDEVSAVSLDEEYSNLTIYQQSYQASARMIKIADQIFQEVIGLIG